MRQAVLELGDTLLSVCTASTRTRLLAVAEREVDVNVLGHEMAKLANSVHDHLAAEPRTS